MYLFTRGSTLLLLLGDLIVFSGALVITLLLRYQEIPSEEVVHQHLRPFVFLFGIWVLIFLISGLYDRHIAFARKKITALIFRVQFVNILLAATIFFILPLGIAPKVNLIIYLMVSTVCVVLWRLYAFPVFTQGRTVKALVIGDSHEATSIANVLASNTFFRHVKPFLLSKKDVNSFEEFRTSLLSFAKEEGGEIIIADMRDEYAARLSRDFYFLAFEDQNIRFFNLPTMYEQLHHRVPPSLIEENWLLENITTSSPHYAYDMLKRCIDIVGACVLLVPALALFPFIFAAIKYEDGGPVFYKPDRVGRFNSVIRIFKFRTMTGSDSPEDALKSTLHVTRIGAFLRKTRLDELPQLLNVLRGDLSFIGPRPEIPTLAHVYAENIPYYNMRHQVKPGLSGWAQINNFDVPRGGVDIERTIDKLSFDLYYLKHRSLLLDTEIALKTINTLILRTGT